MALRGNHSNLGRLFGERSTPYKRPVTRSQQTAATSDEAVKYKISPRTDNYQLKDQAAGHYNAFLVVEGEKLCVIKESLDKVSNGFCKRFAGKEMGIPTLELEDSFHETVLMLNFIYSPKTFKFDENVARELLPIAYTYEVVEAKSACERFLKSVRKPSLEMLTLALKIELESEVVEYLIDRCFRSYTSKELDEQKELPANRDLSTAVYLNIFRKRLEAYENRNGHSTGFIGGYGVGMGGGYGGGFEDFKSSN